MKKILVAVVLSGALAAPVLANTYHGGPHDGPLRHAGWMLIGYPGDPALIDRTIEVSMIEASEEAMFYDIKTIEIAQGETIQFAVSNEGSQAHDFVIASSEEIAEHRAKMGELDDMVHEDDYAVRVVPGDTRTLTWTFANDGEFEFACLIPGHYEAGMRGVLIVY